jgi:hypothetical protein
MYLKAEPLAIMLTVPKIESWISACKYGDNGNKTSEYCLGAVLMT